MAEDSQEKLLSSLVAEIRSYNGADPLLPWLQGIQKMKESLPAPALKEKLPRFLQKCAQAFESERRYRNDPRYLGVWIHLMDFVDDAKVVLRKMERNRIGTKMAMFYCAYAIYYEKRKKFTESEKMYRMGVQIHAEPIEELHKAYEQFLQRMEVYKKRKAKLIEANSGKPSSSRGGISRDKGSGLDKGAAFGSGDNTIIVKNFVGSAIDGRSEAEDACHHGLVDPTINMKEAMNAIGNMFREPLEADVMARRTRQGAAKSKLSNKVLEVFVDDDESLDQGANLENERQKTNNSDSSRQLGRELPGPIVEAFTILADDDEDNFEDKEHRKSDFLGEQNPADQKICILADDDAEENPKCEGSCKFGDADDLFEPTAFTREAMAEINQLFGMPLDF